MNQPLKPILVAAPHLCLPARNGSDISLERVARNLSSHAEYVDLIGSRSLRRYRHGEVENETAFQNQLPSRPLSALRTLVFRSHYFIQRFNTAAAGKMIRKHAAAPEYSTVLASYLTTLKMLPPARPQETRLVWTHNDEFRWFEDIVRTARNPLTKMVAAQSLKWLGREVPGLADQAVFLHVTQTDQQGFDRVAPGHRHLLVSVGTDIDTSPQGLEAGGDDRVILSFMATLSVKMAADALNHFHSHFEPVLRKALGGKLEIRVVGSQPSPAVAELCRTCGWKLFSDVSEADFARLLRESSFTLLPFAYATGIKLKLIRSLGGGVPFLSTTASRPADFPVPPGCCFSDQPADWMAAIQAWRANADRPAARRALFALARSYSWPAVVSRLAGQIAALQACRQ